MGIKARWRKHFRLISASMENLRLARFAFCQTKDEALAYAGSKPQAQISRLDSLVRVKARRRSAAVACRVPVDNPAA
jgi:hypothetical protein